MNCERLLIHLILIIVWIAIQTSAPDCVRYPPQSADRAGPQGSASDRAVSRGASAAVDTLLLDSETEDELDSPEVQAIIRAARAAIRGIPCAR